MSCISTRTVKEYYEYSNGTYELKSINGKPCQRNILKPIPIKDLSQILKYINPKDQKWESKTEQILRAHHFYVQNITHSASVNQEVGCYISGYLKAIFSPKNCLIGGLMIGGAILLVLFTPTLVSKLPPTILKKIGYTASASKRNILMTTLDIWKSMTINSSTKVLKYTSRISIFGLATSALYKLKLIASPSSFWAWQAEIIKKIQDIRNDLIPQKYDNDPILSQNKCNITNFPIREPVRIINTSFIYEAIAIFKWIQDCIDGNMLITIPNSNIPLNRQDIEKDNKMSDKIELRLALLESQ